MGFDKKVSPPIINILLATHNGEKYLEAQLDSFFDQTFQDFLLIVRDDCSTDKTREILKKYKSKYKKKIKIINNDSPPYGSINNFSALIGLSTAPYIMLADQDDVWLHTKIRTSLNAILKSEKENSPKTPLLIFSDMVVVDQQLNQINKSFWKYSGLNPENLSLNHLLIQNVVTGCTTIFNQTLAKKINPIPDEVSMHDHWLALVASAIGKVNFQREALMLYRQHEKNVIGAFKWSRNPIQIIINAFKFLFGRKKNPLLSKRLSQAESLLDRFKNELGQDELTIISTFINLKKMSFFTKRYTILKHKFLMGKWIQNLGLLIKN